MKPKTMHEMFRDSIDATDGTVQINEQQFKAIQADARHAALTEAANLIANIPPHRTNPFSATPITDRDEELMKAILALRDKENHP